MECTPPDIPEDDDAHKQGDPHWFSNSGASVASKKDSYLRKYLKEIKSLFFKFYS